MVARVDEKLHKFTMAVKKAEARNLLGNGFHKQTASGRRMQPHPTPNNVLRDYHSIDGRSERI